jgi:hypothetical protein
MAFPKSESKPDHKPDASGRKPEITFADPSPAATRKTG